MTATEQATQHDWNPRRYRLQEARRKQVLCVAYDVDNANCHYKAVMLWYGIPFCPRHAPAQRPGHGGWSRI